MADVQKYFEQFHKEIRMDYDLNKTLAEKRDIILDRIKNYLKEDKKPLFQSMLQGSYITKTGVKPIEELDYDIDVGLRFDIHENNYAASDVREWLHNATKEHTEKVESKGPCTRVIYKDGYHVDLVAYAVYKNNLGSEIHKLAHKQNGWRDANPIGLLDFFEKVIANYEETEDSATKTNQFRRVVRYIRRWDDEFMPVESDAKPSGLAWILLINRTLGAKVINNGTPDDLAALVRICNSVSLTTGRISIKKPTPEFEDLFAKISDADMEKLKNRFNNLLNVLHQAQNEPSEKKACQLLKKQFGRDFPVPEEDTSGKSLLNKAFVPAGLSFPDKPLVPNKPGKFA